MKIRTKFLTVLIAGVTVGMSAIISLSSRAQMAEAEKAAFYAMAQEAKAESRVVSDMLDRALLTTHGMVMTVQDWIEEGALDRARLAYMMRGFLKADDDFFGVAAAMLPNGLEDNDADHKNSPFSRADGRFNLYFVKGKQEVTLEPLKMDDASVGVWYEHPLKTKQSTITPPFYYPVAGQKVLMTSASSPLLNRQGNAVGVFTVDVGLESIQAAVSKIRPFGVGWAGILTSGKYWVAAQDASLLGRMASEPEADQVLAVTAKGQVFQNTMIDPKTGKLSMVVAVPITFVGAPEIWSFVMVVPTEAVMASAIQTRDWMMVTGGIVLVLSLVGVVLFAGTISTPIRTMTEVMKRLADGDNQVEIPAHNHADEIEEMAKAVRVFRENAIARLRLERAQEAAKQELKYRAYHDSLTGLFNRFALSEIEQDWLSMQSVPFALLYLDLDNFKNINDAFGHACGDVILTEVAKRLQENVPDGSAIVRHGGDEFAIFVPYDEEVCLDALGADTVQAVSKQYHVYGMQLHIGVSIGIARFPHDGVQLDPLMVAADLAMRLAKRKKNSYAFYSQDMQEDMRRKVSIEYQLRDALLREEIYIVYQPQLTASGEIYGVEALVRWENPELGFVPPDQFIAIAEETGQIIPLGEYIMHEACAGFANVLNACGLAGAPLSLSINISINQFLEERFKEKLQQCVEDAGLCNHNVTIEITESLFINEPEIVLPLLNEIRATGIKVSLDDFGTGYSSLSTLRTLPIDELKIDKAFIDNICHVEQDAEMTRSIIAMGHTMHLRIVSEGVENQEQVELLKGIQCDVFQGYHYSKPLRQGDLIAYIKSFNSL